MEKIKLNEKYLEKEQSKHTFNFIAARILEGKSFDEIENILKGTVFTRRKTEADRENIIDIRRKQNKNEIDLESGLVEEVLENGDYIKSIEDVKDELGQKNSVPENIENTSLMELTWKDKFLQKHPKIAKGIEKISKLFKNIGRPKEYSQEDENEERFERAHIELINGAENNEAHDEISEAIKDALEAERVVLSEKEIKKALLIAEKGQDAAFKEIYKNNQKAAARDRYMKEIQVDLRGIGNVEGQPANINSPYYRHNGECVIDEKQEGIEPGDE